MIIRQLVEVVLLLAAGAFGAQPSALPPLSAPLRDLSWGQLNFLHTTDTHGWLAGHLNEPSYGADWGDYISFRQHLQDKVDKEGKDLVVVDSGDRIEGNGLYDAAHPKGKYILNIFREQHVDILCSGNHELYKNHSSYDEYHITVPEFQGNYLASNIDIYDDKTGERRPLAQRYKKFKTKNQGIRITAFGFLFNFDVNSNNTVVQKVEDTIKEGWFKNAIRDRDVDLFLVAGHVPLRSQEFPAIFRAIRKQNWDVPVVFLGGHLHIRDFAKYDDKAYGMESGRYMETIGFMSVTGLNTAPKSSLGRFLPRFASRHLESASTALKVSRRYIDNNLFSFRHHSSLNESEFPTSHGLNVSAQISSDRSELGLDKRFGCAPQDYWTDRVPFPSNASIFSWLQDFVLPDVVEKTEPDRPKILITNTGAIRFDIFKGDFTADSLYIISPFTSGFRVIRGVPFKKAKQVLTVLNENNPILWSDPSTIAFKMPVSHENLKLQSSYQSDQTRMQVPLAGDQAEEELSPGYVTTDDAGSGGDDTKHSPVKHFKAPNCIESRVSFPDKTDGTTDPDEVDLIYVDFIERYVVLALEFLGTDYSATDTSVYMQNTTLTGAIGKWVERNWKCDSN